MLLSFGFDNQVRVIKAVRNSLDSSGDVTTLWVTHRLEKLEYADGRCLYGRWESYQAWQCSTTRQSAYIKEINS